MALFLFILSSTVITLYLRKSNNKPNCDAPEVWQLKLQDPSSSIMEGILMFNKHLLFIIIVIVVLVGWLLVNTIHSFENSNNSNIAKFFHSNPLEILWT